MDTPQLLSTSADDEVAPDTTTSDETEVILESASADEKAESESTTTSDETEVILESASADEKAESESSSGDEKVFSEIGLQEEEEKEEEEECGFCLFMKSGPCGERFKFWQDCVEGAETSNKDIVEQCAQTTNLLKVCMEMNPQYYGPVLDAEKAMQADIESTEGIRTDGAQSPEPPAEGEGVVAGGNDDQTIEVVERVDMVVDDKGQVVEVVDTVEVDVKASEGTRTDGGQFPERPSEGDGFVDSGNGDQTMQAVERVDIVVDEKGQVTEVVDDVEIEIAA